MRFARGRQSNYFLCELNFYGIDLYKKEALQDFLHLHEEHRVKNGPNNKV
jgi:hypothetical protein